MTILVITALICLFVAALTIPLVGIRVAARHFA